MVLARKPGSKDACGTRLPGRLSGCRPRLEYDGDIRWSSMCTPCRSAPARPGVEMRTSLCRVVDHLALRELRRCIESCRADATPDVAWGVFDAVQVSAPGGLELPGHASDHDPEFEQQPALEPQGTLVVQQVFPPTPHDVFGDIDADDIAGAG